MRRLFAAFAGLLFLSLGATTAFAETPQRAGRLSYIEGSVSVRAQDDQNWAPAQLNLPVTTGTALWTEPGAHAEVEIGATTIRIDSETELDVTRLDDRTIEIAVPQGAVNIHRGPSPDGAIWIVTPNGPVTLSQPGFYRVADGAVTPVGSDPSPFDRWAMARENAAEQAQAETLRYVSPETTGYQDLAAAGSWTVTPDYGAVWYPRAIPIGWAPYRYGHWAYVFPWGWTWIDDAPWGFAPFHYGRWVQLHGRWGWWPGERHARPIFVPAHVVFVAGGHDRHAPPRRWVPLAPREAAPRVAVAVHIDVNRFANRAAVSSRPRATVERQARRGTAPAPHPVARERQAIAAPRAEAPRAVERPQATATRRGNGADVHRRPPETRVSPAVPVPEERARLSAPQSARREAGRDQPRAEAVAPRPQPAPLPQVVRPQSAPQPRDVQPLRRQPQHAQRPQPQRDMQQPRPQASPPAQPAPQPQAQRAAQRERARHGKKDEAPRS